MSLIQELQKVGLSDKEAKVYLSTLELGQSSVQHIAQKAKVNRATTYAVLEALINKGLCGTFEQGKKTYYIASAPDSLISLFELRKKDIEEKEKYFKKLLPELKLVHNRQEDKPIVKFFEGKTGLLNCIDEFYAPGKKDDVVRMVYNSDLLEKFFSAEERSRYRKIRLGKKVKSLVLYNKKEGEKQTTVDGERIKIDGVKYPIACDIGIYGDTVRFASLVENLSSIMITNKEIVQTIKILFDLAWQAAKNNKNQ